MNGIKDLLWIGAKSILLFNQSPIQAFPYIRVFNQNSLFTLFTLEGNNVLLQNMAEIQKNNTKSILYIFDLNRIITKLISNHSKIFKNTVDQCLNV